MPTSRQAGRREVEKQVLGRSRQRAVCARRVRHALAK
jgi:hypothetical protein